MTNPLAIDGAFSFTVMEARMYKNPRPQTNYKAVIKEWIAGFLGITLILVAILGWQIALSAPNCSINYKTGITTCV